MKRHILLFATVASILFTFVCTAQELPVVPAQQGPEPMYDVLLHEFQVPGTSTYAHPQQLTRSEMSRILSSLKYDMDFGMRAAVLNAEEQIQLGEAAAELFKTAAPDTQVLILKTMPVNANEDLPEIRRLEIYLCFLDENTLYASVGHRSMPVKGSIAVGRNMIRYTNPEGRSPSNIVCIDRKLWTTDKNKPVFEVDKDALKEALARKQEMDSKSDQTPAQEEAAPASLTVEELEKELSRLRNLLDKELINREEYEKLRAELMKRAGIGGTGNGS